MVRSCAKKSGINSIKENGSKQELQYSTKPTDSCKKSSTDTLKIKADSCKKPTQDTLDIKADSLKK